MNYEDIDSKVSEFVKAMLAEKETEYFCTAKTGTDPMLAARCYTLGYVQSMLTQAIRLGGADVQNRLFSQMDRHFTETV